MSDRSKECQQLLLSALKNPNSLVLLKLHEWELLIRCARSCKLLATLGNKAASYCDESLIPHVVEHFVGAQQLVDYRKQLVMWELNRLNKTLAELDVDFVVLKGGAYNVLGLSIAQGRLMSDIDILVNKKELARVEEHLLVQGWITTKLDDYDQNYYRTWMHEIPPLRHRDRFVEVDIHHTILPLTSRLHPDPERLLNDAVNVDNSDCKVLSPCDMVLHSTVHLFYDAELNAQDFRDLVDLHELLSFYSQQDAEFWDKLNNRAEELALQRPLYYTLYFTRRLLNTPVPDYLIINNKNCPNYITRQLMAYLVPLAILPEHPDNPERKVGFARWLLYVRSHYIRMPLLLLIPHLFKKSKKQLDFVPN